MKNLSLGALAIPIYADMVLKLATILINTYMISRVDVRLVAATGAGNQVFALFVTIFSFLSVGCSVFVAQALGAKLKSTALRATHISMTFNAILGLLCGLLVFIFTKEILSLLQVPSNLLRQSVSYLKALSVVFIIDAVAILIAAIIRVYGYTMHILLVSVVMNVITIVGNYLALFGPFGLPHFGLLGVGISTAFGRFIGVFILFIILFKVAKINFYPSLLIKFKPEIFKKILSVGFPSAGENLLWTVQYLVAFSFVASMGDDPLTVQTIYFQFSAFIFFAATSISIANEVIVGRLVGENRPDKAYETTFFALKIALICTGMFLAAIFLAKEMIMDIFNLPPHIKEIMRPLFTLTLVLEFGRTLNIVMVNSLRASGDAKFPLYAGVVFMWGVSIPVGYFLGIHQRMGILGVWIGFVCDEWLRGIANTLRWKNKKWLSKKLV